LAKSAEARVGLLNEGAADDPVKLPKNVWAAALESVNVRAGVLVAVATDVVNSGLNVPAEKVVMVPEEAAVHVKFPEPSLVRTPAVSAGYNLEFQGPRPADVIYPAGLDEIG
jgi:hypothetical protein